MDWLDVLEWDEKKLDDLRYVAYSYIKQGCYDTALTFFKALAVLTAPTAYDLQTIGAIHLQLGNGRDALQNLDEALKREPAHLPTQLNRAKALLMLGYTEQGVVQAKALINAKDKEIQSQATALIMANS